MIPTRSGQEKIADSFLFRFGFGPSITIKEVVLRKSVRAKPKIGNDPALKSKPT
jgi:hypothetical protein